MMKSLFLKPKRLSLKLRRIVQEVAVLCQKPSISKSGYVFFVISNCQMSELEQGVVGLSPAFLWENGCPTQGRTKWRNCKLSPKTPDYQLGWTVLAASRRLDTLKCNTVSSRLMRISLPRISLLWFFKTMYY